MSLPFAKKALGQHWLSDDKALEAMCYAADVGPEDTVLEIGPGTGTLTRKLVQRAKQVVAIELDPKLAEKLHHLQIAKNLQIVSGDILTFDLTGLPAGYKVVANIPYYLTSNLLRTLCESPNPPSRMALLSQKEVAERVVAGPGNMSLLSVSVQFYCEASLGQIVPARLFTPPPKVESQILKLAFRIQPLFPDVDTNKFFQLVKAGYAARRKTLLNSLSGGLRIGKAEVGNLLEAAGIIPSTRPQELGLDDWHSLYKAWQNI
jgi:16S rRNA (adenine1518-N6/adenine1519-N6)-dimethyltransferase